jgi:hypothetical protein
MAFAIKAGIDDPRAKTFAFTAQKTMYGGKHIAKGGVIFLFSSENEGGQGLIARGVVTPAEAPQTRHRPSDAAGEHHGRARGAGEAAAGTQGAQAVC